MAITAFVVRGVLAITACLQTWRERLRDWLDGCTPGHRLRHQDVAARLQRRVTRAALSARTVGLRYEHRMPPRVTVGVSDGDYRLLDTSLPGGVQEAVARITCTVRSGGLRRGYDVPRGFTLTIVADPARRDGRPRRAGPGGQATTLPDGGAERAPAPYHGTTITVPISMDPDPDPDPDTGDEDPPPFRKRRLPHCELVPTDGSEPFDLSTAGDLVRIGRIEGDLVLTHPAVSRRHAELHCSEGVWTLVDVGSRNGTFLNGVRVTRAELLNADRVTFSTGGPTFIFARFENALE